MPEGTCSIPDCNRPVRVKVRGWCALHYQKWQRHGDPLGEDPGRASLVGQRFARLTVVSFDVAAGEWLCACDCGRATHARRNQLTSGQKLSCGTPGPCRWRKDGPVSYDTMHARLVRAKGTAADHQCVDCGKRADHWSYDHADQAELTEVLRGCSIPYSIDLDHYEARCRFCHRRFDLRHADARRGA